MTGEDFTAGGNVYIAIYDQMGAKLYETRWAEATPAVIVTGSRADVPEARQITPVTGGTLRCDVCRSLRGAGADPRIRPANGELEQLARCRAALRIRTGPAGAGLRPALITVGTRFHCSPGNPAHRNQDRRPRGRRFPSSSKGATDVVSRRCPPAGVRSKTARCAACYRRSRTAGSSRAGPARIPGEANGHQRTTAATTARPEPDPDASAVGSAHGW